MERYLPDKKHFDIVNNIRFPIIHVWVNAWFASYSVTHTFMDSSKVKSL